MKTFTPEAIKRIAKLTDDLDALRSAEKDITTYKFEVRGIIGVVNGETSNFYRLTNEVVELPYNMRRLRWSVRATDFMTAAFRRLIVEGIEEKTKELEGYGIKVEP